jgi:hypothetical protein
MKDAILTPSKQMAKVYLQLVTKNFALDGDKIEIESDIIPRVGEIIDAQEYCSIPKGNVSNYIVTSVIYKLTKSGFVSYISAQAWWQGFRHELLQERGWLLPNEHTHLTYDENDPAMLENVPQG